MNKTEIRELMESTSWRYRFEILPGVFTPGHLEVNPSKVLTAYEVPESISGRRVLDIGAWDGLYSFELEHRGADVVAFDIQDPNKTGFRIAQRILDSDVTYVQDSVYNLNIEDHGMFDIVLFAGVYYHLKHPLLAFRNIQSVLKGDGTLFFSGQILDFAYKKDEKLKNIEGELLRLNEAQIPLALFVSGDYIDEKSNWFIPNAACLKEWLIASGFDDIKVVSYDAYSTCRGVAHKKADFESFEHALVGEKFKWYGL